MNERPTVLELLEAAREHLQRKVVGAIEDPALRFQTLVAAHVIGVCAREIQAGNARVEQSVGAFAGLLGAKPGESGEMEALLCDAIRRGAFDEAPSALIDELRRDVESSLALWNPGFLERVRREPGDGI